MSLTVTGSCDVPVTDRSRSSVQSVGMEEKALEVYGECVELPETDSRTGGRRSAAKGAEFGN